MANDIVTHRSTLREFLASIATISGDLSNITAPPFVLAEHSTVEIPQYWADHPHLFVAPAAESNPERRNLLVLKWFIASLRNQQYAGRKEDEGVKKPLNAFLGELFFGRWKEEGLGETKLVSEQVSHHPPVTACYLWNDKHGIRAEGFTQQMITFSTNVSIKQKGYALLHIDEYHEDYLIPLPDVKVKGILSGVPYPELHGEYSLISSTGYISHIKFEGKGIFGSGDKNSFEARTFHIDQPEEDLYTVKGAWNGSFTFHDLRAGKDIESFDITTYQSSTMEVPDVLDQDPWESWRAWANVSGALRNSDMKGTTEAKSVIEEGQRHMRKDEEARGEHWKSVFFKTVNKDPVFEKLVVHDKGSFTVGNEGGIWKVDVEAVVNAKKPYHGQLLPTNKMAGDAQKEDQRQEQSLQNEFNSDTRPSPNQEEETITNEESTQELAKASTAQQASTALEEQRAMSVAEETPHGTPDHTSAVANNVSTITSNLTQSVLTAVSGTGSDNTTISVHQPTNETSSLPEPTDRQVEDFLRAKHTSTNQD